jgi:hypothetical protein
LSGATTLSMLPAFGFLVGAGLLLAGGDLRPVGAALVLVYGGLLILSGAHAAFRFRSGLVGALQPFAVVATHAAYLAGFLRGVVAN